MYVYTMCDVENIGYYVVQLKYLFDIQYTTVFIRIQFRFVHTKIIK